MEGKKYKLTYFNGRGAAEKVRLLFAYYKIPFEDERIMFKEWPALKKKCKYGHLPVLLVDGKKEIVQS
jgi:glutathione S-transferase